MTRRAIAIGLPALLLGATAALAVGNRVAGASAEQAASAARFGQPGTAKVMIDRNAPDAAALLLQGRVIAEYDAFIVAEFAADALPESDGASVLTDENLILLNAGTIDTSTAAGIALQEPAGEFAGNKLRLVQFAAAMRPDWYAQFEATGVRIVTSMPYNAYLVYGDSASLKALDELAARQSNIQWIAPYRDEYKIDPTAAVMIDDESLAQGNQNRFIVQLVEDETSNKATRDLVDKIRTGDVTGEYSFIGYHNFVAAMPPGLLPLLAAQPDVVSIQPYYEPTLFDERQDQIIAGNTTGNLPNGATYLAWLGTKGFTQAQFTASNFAVDVSDSGLDNGTTTPNHFGLFVNGTRPGTSRVAYTRLVGTPHSGSTLKGCDGHGTLNSHIIGGYSASSGSPFTDGAGYHYGLGVAPFVRVGSSVIFDPSSFTSPNYPNLQSQAYNDNARISSNSWGNTSGNTYNSDSQSYDALVRDAQPTGSTFATAGNQEMVIVFAAGNSGSAANTVHPPATAKNVITVGASEGVQAFGGSDNCATPDSQADSLNDMATFSSRGPCSDNRKKPEIVAPGTHISGGVAQTASPAATGTADACYNGTGVCGGVGSNFFPAGQQFYTASTGTSHSTPCVSGGAALIRQYFINQGLTPPSPAMTKAMLMNSARRLTGTGANDTLWSNSQGMGLMNLGDLFLRTPSNTVIRDEVAGDIFTGSGQTRTFTGTIADTTKPFRVSLSWTDAVGSTTGSAIRNNLNLTVVIGANTYLGNVFSSGNSVTGGAADTLNNSESVFLPAGTSGSYTVTVTGATIGSDGVPNSGTATDQDFALVIYNTTVGACTGASISGQPTAQTVCSGSSASFTVTAGGTAPFTYQWRKGGSNITGATSATYTIASTVVGDAGNYDCFVTNGCGNATSNAVALTVNTGPSIGTQPAAQSVCVGSPATFSVVASGTAPLGYQWRKGLANISGATSSSYTIPSTVVTDAGSYDCVITNSCGNVISNAVALNVNSAASVSGQPTNQSVCSGSSVSLSVTAGGTAPFTYQWRKGTTNLANGGAVSGATSATLTINPAVVGDAASNYNCVITNGCGSATSNNATIAVNTAATIATQPTNQAGCVGGTVSLNVAAGGMAPFTYQWRKGTTNLADGGAISGATSATLTINPVALGDAASNYNCVITNGCGSATSNNASVTVNTGPSLPLPLNSQTACAGSSVSFSVAAAGTVPFTYQWRRGTTNLTNGGNISGATSDTLTIDPVAPGDAASNYNCVVTNGCGNIVSNNAALTVNVGASITDQPSSQSVCTGLPASFTVVASGTATIEYQWRKGGMDIGGATNATYTIASTVAGDVGSYDCVVTNGCGTVTSDAVTLTVNSGPSIDTPPSNQGVCSGSPASFSVAASGTAPLSYQWRKGGVDIGGATNASYSIPSAVGGDAGSYDCVVTNGCGSATSAAATLTVGSGPAINTQPAPVATCSGLSASFTVAASGDAPISYQWRRGVTNLTDGGTISGATSATLTINPAGAGDVGGDYNCVVSNGCGSTTSSDAALSFDAAPSISGQPGNQSVCLGSPASFSVTASGATGYQWRKGGMDISGETNATLTIASAGAGDAGSYDCVVAGACGNATSNAAMLTVGSGPQIDTQPGSASVTLGGAASFSIAASGGTLGYQWRRGTTDLVDGGNVSGATSSMLTISPAAYGDAASDYNCVVTAECGSATSDNVSLTVDHPPCPGDLTGDGQINLSDLSRLLANFGRTDAGPADGDLNGDGAVNLTDLSRLLSVFGTVCP